MSKDELWGRLVPAFLCLWLASIVIPSLSLLPRGSVDIWPIDYCSQNCCFQGTRAALQSLPVAPILSLETKMRNGERGKVKCLTRSLFLRIEIHNQLNSISKSFRLLIPNNWERGKSKMFDTVFVPKDWNHCHDQFYYLMFKNHKMTKVWKGEILWQ